MQFQVTVRYGTERQRYHLSSVSAPDLAEALRRAAESLPEEVARTGDLVEVRPAVDPEGRSYTDEGPGPRERPAEPGPDESGHTESQPTESGPSGPEPTHPDPHSTDPGPG
jgi:hypothetical protein